VAVDDFNHEVGVGHVVLGGEVDDLALVVGVEHLFLHHAFAYCCHLGAAVGVDDSGYDIAAECGADLIEQVGVFLACLGVFVVADFKRGAVGGETAVEARAHAGAEVAAYAGGAHKAYLRLNLAEEVDEDCGVRIGGVGVETDVFHLIHYVGAVGEYLFFDAVEFVADNDCFEFYAETVGQHAAFSEKLKADVCHTAFVVFAVYYEVVIV
jgi:hypothetical protein